LPAGPLPHRVGATGKARNRESQPLLKDEAAVRELEAAYDDAWNRADLDALVSPFAPDATIIDPFGGVSSGRDEIRRLLSELLAGSGRGSTHTGTILSVRFVSADVALADGEAVIEGLHDADGVVRPPLLHRFTDVLIRTADGWRISQVRAYVFLTGPRP
jgi:uncharacterized protein (TIGR02246 family)